MVEVRPTGLSARGVQSAGGLGLDARSRGLDVLRVMRGTR